MTDIFDRAAEAEETMRSAALADQARRAGMDAAAERVSAFECVICEDAIPESRRAAVPGVRTCVACQDELERASHINAGRRP